MEFKPLSDYAKRKIFPDHWETLNACLGLQFGNFDDERLLMRINYRSCRWMTLEEAKDFIEGFYFWQERKV